jgi:hypothetical protein
VKVEGWLFAGLFFFFSLLALVYGLWADGEPIGTVALIFTALLSFLVGYYLLFTARRIDRRPEDRLDAEIAEGAGELGFYSPHSWWPLACGAAAALAFSGIVFGWWLFLIGAGIGAMSVIGLVFEYYRGEPAH